jgi:hypothetical protein
MENAPKMPVIYVGFKKKTAMEIKLSVEVPIKVS